MKLIVFEYTCDKCKSTYHAIDLNSDSYGEFLMRSRAGEVLYLNALKDPIYAEVDDLLRKLPYLKDESAVKRASIQRKFFGIACDPDSEGNRFGIETKPPCKFCGNDRPSYWEATDPPEFVDMDVPKVTHHEWNHFNQSEKIQALDKAVRSDFR